MLLQERDLAGASREGWRVVTRRQPTEAERRAMSLGWRVAKHVKSNAIVFADAEGTLGIGAGQMSRVDASRIAVWKAGEAGLALKGGVVCSDAAGVHRVADALIYGVRGNFELGCNFFRRQ